MSLCVRPLLVVLAGLTAAACGGSRNPAGTPASSTPTTPTAPTVTRTYTGVVTVQARPGKSGVFTLSSTQPAPITAAVSEPQATSPVTGTLSTLNGQTFPLTGTFDTNGNVVAVSGGGYQLTATATSTALSGTGTQAAEAGMTVGVVGAAAAVLDRTQKFCGTFRSVYNYNSPIQTSGQFQFVATDDDGNASYDVWGQFVNDLDGTRGVLVGTLNFYSGDRIGLGVLATDHKDRNGVAPEASGVWNGSNWSGTYNGGDPVGQEYGNWQAQRCG